jgi:cell division protein FtsB
MAAASRIRWDRLGRWALIGVFALVLYLYIGPAVSWVSAYKQSGEKRAEVQALKARNHDLLARRAELRDAKALELEARRLGMVKAGEKAFVVELPRR